MLCTVYILLLHVCHPIRLFVTDDHTYSGRRFGIWTRLYDCSWHRFTARQFVVKCTPLTDLAILQQFGWNLNGGKGGVSDLRCGDQVGHGLSGMDPFDSLPMGSYELLINTNAVSLTVLSYLQVTQKRFSPSGLDAMSFRPITYLEADLFARHKILTRSPS